MIDHEEAVRRANEAVSICSKTCTSCARRRKLASVAIENAVRETAEECAKIALTHKDDWIRPSEGAAPIVVGSHACHLVADAIFAALAKSRGESDAG